MSEYTEQANRFLEQNGIGFRAVQKGDKCPMWCDGKHTHGDRYLVGFSRTNARFSLSFWNSLNDAQKGIAPTAYDVIATMTKYDPGTFENFCSEFGYDTDSRKAESTYKAVVKEWQKVEGFFTNSELEQIREIQ